MQRCSCSPGDCRFMEVTFGPLSLLVALIQDYTRQGFDPRI